MSTSTEENVQHPCGDSWWNKQEVKVSLIVFAVLCLCYHLFVFLFGSADGSKSAGRASTKGSKAPKKFSATEEKDEERARAIEFAKEALPKPSSPVKKQRTPPPSPTRSLSPPAKKSHKAKVSSSKNAIPNFFEGDMVEVVARSESGSKPREGGVGRVTAVNKSNDKGGFVYDVTYVLGGREAGLAQRLLSEASMGKDSTPKRVRQPSSKVAAAMEDAAEVGGSRRRR